MAKAALELFEGFGWDTGGSGCLVQLLKEQINFFLWEPHASFDSIKNPSKDIFLNVPNAVTC